MSKELTIVCVTYNNPEGAKELISDFYRLHNPDTFTFISIDMTKDGIIFDKEKPELQIRTKRNLGFSQGMNIGWSLSRTPYTLLANDDVRLLRSSWYEEARAHLDSKDVLAVNPFPALRTWNGGGEPTWYYDTNPKFEWTKGKAYESYTEEEYKQLQKDLWGGCSNGTTTFFTLVRTELRDIVGMFDENFPINASDYDLNRRIFLTCAHCNKRKNEHLGDELKCSFDESTYFSPYKMLTCTHSLVHHHCGVTKQIAQKNKEVDGYDLVASAKVGWGGKWGSEECKDPDIYGRDGLIIPSTPWYKLNDL